MPKSFYDFIKDYSKMASPLTDLLKKYKYWEWFDDCQETFQKIKHAMTSKPVLRLPDFELLFEVHTNASNRAIGGVLVQERHPIAFESRKLKEAEQRYSTHEKKMTVVVHCLEIWKHYFLGTKFVVVTTMWQKFILRLRRSVRLSRHGGKNF